MNRKLASLVMMGALMLGSYYPEYGHRNQKNNKIDVKPKNKPIPKGCKLYTYVESFGTLEVIAHNEKTALKKYQKWFNSNSA